MFDISTIEIADTFELALIDPRTEDQFVGEMEVDDGAGGTKKVPAPASITLWSPGTKQARAAQAENRKRYLKTFRNGKSQEEPEQEEARVARFLQENTVSFNNFTYQGGDPKSADTHRACYGDPKAGWISRAVNEALDNWGKSMKSGQPS